MGQDQKQRKPRIFEFKDYKEFIDHVFKKGRQFVIDDYKWGPTSDGYFINIFFRDGEVAKYSSKHMKWYDDIIRVITKINIKFNESTKTKN